MKLLMICCAGANIDDVRAIVERHDVHGFTEIPELRGSGQSGRRMGSRAWPGSCSMLLTAVGDDRAGALLGALEEFAGRCLPDEGVRVMVLPIERMI